MITLREKTVYTKHQQLTKNFVLGEYFKNDRDWQYFLKLTPPAQKELFNNILSHSQKLQLFRNYKNEPIFILSGFRCPETNLLVGGAKQSFHMKAMAADIYYKSILKSPDKDFIQLSVIFGGVLYYKISKFFHTDIRSIKYHNFNYQ